MSWFKKKEKAALDAAVKASARPTTALFVDSVFPDSHPFLLTTTHFGGEPYAEKGETWPTWGESGRPFDLVCQINLQECPYRPEAPFDLIVVYLCWKGLEEWDGEEEEPCLVRSYRNPSPTKGVKLRRPEPLEDDDYQVRACSVRMEAVVTYPWVPERRYPAIDAAALEFWWPDDAYQASLKRLGYRASLRRSGCWGTDFSRVGGYAEWVHCASLEYDDLVFLAQINYEPEANNCIGDAAPIFIAFPASDPAKIEIDFTQTH